MSKGTSDIRVGVVGVGLMGGAHVDRLTGVISGACVTVVVDPDESRGSAVSRRAPGSVWYSQLSDALADQAVDAVLIASPGQHHEEAVIACIDAGLPVLCEKPLSIETASAKRIVDREMAGAVALVQVGFHRRFDSGYRQLKALIESSEAGQLLGLHCRHRNQQLPRGWDSSMLISDAAVHEMDIVAWLAGEPVVGVAVHPMKRNSLGPSQVSDPLMIMLWTESGVLADVEINVNSQAAYQVRTEAVFERGSAEIGGPSGLGRTEDGRWWLGEHTTFATRFADAYADELRYWIDDVRASRMTGPSAWAGYCAVRLCEAGLESQRNGHRVAVPVESTPDFYS